MPSLLFSAFVPFFLTLLLLFLFILVPRSGGKSGSNKKADGVKVTNYSYYPDYSSNTCVCSTLVATTVTTISLLAPDGACELANTLK